MTLNDIKNYVCGRLHLSSATEYEQDHTSMAEVCNSILDDLYGAISWKNLGYFGTYSAVDVVGSVRLYVIPDEVLNKIHKIEVKLGGSGENVYKPLKIRTINDYPDFVFDEVWITNNFTNENPEGFILGNALYILSGTVPAGTDALRYYFLQFLNEITSMDATFELSKIHDNFGADGQTITIGLPRQFHKIVAEGIIIDYKEGNDLPLSQREQNYELRIKEKLNELSPLSADESFQASVGKDDGSEY